MKDYSEIARRAEEYLSITGRYVSCECLEFARAVIEVAKEHERAISQITYEFDVPDPELISRIDNKGHASTLECLIHEIWKSDPKVQQLTARVQELETENKELKIKLKT